MLNVHEKLDEAIKAGYVVRRGQNYNISNKYWKWCSDNTKPFVAITLGSPNSRYANVEMDLYLVADVGFSSNACYEILHFFLGTPLKTGSDVHISPTFINATVKLNAVNAVTKFLYDFAIEKDVCRTHEELFATALAHAAKGSSEPRDGPSFGFTVHKKTLEMVATTEFWNSITSDRDG